MDVRWTKRAKCLICAMSPRLFLLLIAPLALAQNPDAPKKWDAEQVKASVKVRSASEAELGEIKINAETRSVSFPATLKIVKGPLEYMIVNERGSAHEALFMTKVSPFELNVAMLLAGFKQSETFFRKAKPDSFPELSKGAKIDPTSTFEIWVDWTDEEGKAHSHPAEEWVYNLDTKKSVSTGVWVYNGSQINQNGDLAAQVSGNILALYVDPNSLANNPRSGNDNDDIWVSKPVLPKEGLPVTLRLKLLTGKENNPKNPVPPASSSQPAESPSPKSTK